MLGDVIEKSGERQTVWAKRLGITTGYLSALVNGQKIPSLILAVRIEVETGGAVPARSWVSVAPEEDAAA